MFCYSFRHSLSGHCCLKRSLHEKQQTHVALKVIFMRFEEIILELIFFEPVNKKLGVPFLFYFCMYVFIYSFIYCGHLCTSVICRVREGCSCSLRCSGVLVPHSRVHGLAGNLAKCETCQEYASIRSPDGF